MDFDTRDRFTELVQQLENGISLLFFIQADMDRNIFEAKEYASAVYVAWKYLSDTAGGLQRLGAEGGEQP